MNGTKPFWEKPLATLDRGEWEALCDGCGRCCLHKLEDEDTRPALPDQRRLQAARPQRTASAPTTATARSHVADCVKLDPARRLDELEWLPSTCAYRLRFEGKPLLDWHYLVSGSRETVHEAGQSTRGWTVSEVDAGELEWHVVDRAL